VSDEYSESTGYGGKRRWRDYLRDIYDRVKSAPYGRRQQKYEPEYAPRNYSLKPNRPGTYARDGMPPKSHYTTATGPLMVTPYAKPPKQDFPGMLKTPKVDYNANLPKWTEVDQRKEVKPWEEPEQPEELEEAPEEPEDAAVDSAVEPVAEPENPELETEESIEDWLESPDLGRRDLEPGEMDEIVESEPATIFVEPAPEEVVEVPEFPWDEMIESMDNAEAWLEPEDDLVEPSEIATEATEQEQTQDLEKTEPGSYGVG